MGRGPDERLTWDDGATQVDLIAETSIFADDEATGEAVIIGSVTGELALLDYVAAGPEGHAAQVFYVDPDTASSLTPASVPERAGSPSGPMTPYERFVLDGVDGARSVTDLQREGLLSRTEIAAVLLNLLERGILKMSVARPEVPSTPAAPAPLAPSPKLSSPPPASAPQSPPRTDETTAEVANPAFIASIASPYLMAEAPPLSSFALPYEEPSTSDDITRGDSGVRPLPAWLLAPKVPPPRQIEIASHRPGPTPSASSASLPVVPPARTPSVAPALAPGSGEQTQEVEPDAVLSVLSAARPDELALPVATPRKHPTTGQMKALPRPVNAPPSGIRVTQPPKLPPPEPPPSAGCDPRPTQPPTRPLPTSVRSPVGNDPGLSGHSATVRARARSMFDEALSARAAQDLVGARMKIKLAIALDPNNLDYQRLFFELGERAGPANHLRRMSSPEAQRAFEEGCAAELKNELDRAILSFERSLSHAEEPMVLNRLGVLLATRKRAFARARAALERAVELDPDSSVYQSNLQKVIEGEQARPPAPSPRRAVSEATPRRGILAELFSPR